MKIIAHYLPQFHEIDENNEWWGKGFTEWTNTKKAKPLFNNHYQPKEPMNDFYYNLLDDKVRKWQAELAQKYGIYGFCYYHYWFNGKLLLEKPLEMLLKSKEPNFPFCIAWANEPWTRAWYAEKKPATLIEQEYGAEKEWRMHFQYLLKAFKDDRYIKKDGKPIFIIYRAESIECLDDMLSLWNKLAKENGFPGIYFIRMLTCFSQNLTFNSIDAELEFEPGYTMKYDLSYFSKLKKKSKRFFNIKLNKIGINTNCFLDIIDYDLIWSKIIKRKPKNKKRYFGAFVDWDDTARRGSNSVIMRGGTPEKFYKNMVSQIKKSKDYDNDFLFINAWNEWAEGTYLEPDKKYEYKYLEAINKALIETNELT